MRRLLAFVTALMMAVTGAVLANASAASATDASSAMEQQFFDLLNGTRAANGLAPLARDSGLDGVALEWSGHMAAQSAAGLPVNLSLGCAGSALCHRPNLGAMLGSVEPNWIQGGENVGVGGDVVGLHNAFVASPGHFHNILGGDSGKYNRLGVGVVVQGPRIWVTFNFLWGPPLPSTAPPPAPTPAVAAVPVGAQRLDGGRALPAVERAGDQAYFLPRDPLRVLDTRTGLGSATALDGSNTITLALGDQPGRPAHATIALLNVTATGSQGDGFVTVYPCGRPVPTASNVNFKRAENVPNLVTVGLGASQSVCLFSNVATHVVADLSGWYDSVGGSSLSPSSPQRAFDSRTSTGRAQAFIVTLAGASTDATAATLNVTITNPAADGYLTVYPCDATLPEASNLNFSRGQTVPNMVTVRLPADHRVCLYSKSLTDVVVDVFGFYGTTGARITPVVPVRLLDTRDGTGGWSGTLTTDQVIDLAVRSAPGMAASSNAVVMNVTVTGTETAGFLTVYSCDSPAPATSNLNFVTGQTVANLVTVQLGASGRVCFTTNGHAQVIADLAGYMS